MIQKKFSLPITLENRNDGQGHHWARTQKAKDRYSAILRTLQNPFFGISFPCSLLVVRVLGKRQRIWDPDSVLRGNWKQIQDAMVHAGWIPDDNFRHFDLVIGDQDATRRSQGPGIDVIIVDADKLRKAIGQEKKR